jgi:hypothetical protein
VAIRSSYTDRIRRFVTLAIAETNLAPTVRKVFDSDFPTLQNCPIREHPAPTPYVYRTPLELLTVAICLPKFEIFLELRSIPSEIEKF